MARYEQKASDIIPTIVFDDERHLFELTGRSVPNDASAIYEPAIDWLKQYFKSPGASIRVECSLEYFNTSTQKFLMSMFKLMHNGAKANGSTIEVNWHYEEGDDEVRQIGAIFSKLVGLEFNLISYEEED